MQIVCKKKCYLASSSALRPFATSAHTQVGQNGGAWQLQQLQSLCSNFIIMEDSFTALCPAYRHDTKYARSNKQVRYPPSLTWPTKEKDREEDKEETEHKKSRKKKKTTQAV